MGGFCIAQGEKDLSQFARSIIDLFRGASHASGSFTVAEDATSTVVLAPNCSPTAKVFLQATSATAAAEVGGGTIYVSAKAQGQFTVTHANDPDTTRTFDYELRV